MAKGTRRLGGECDSNISLGSRGPRDLKQYDFPCITEASCRWDCCQVVCEYRLDHGQVSIDRSLVDTGSPDVGPLALDATLVH